ncbi:hypothetical protein G6F23_014258 [Rhizopus arrhizus]|nr:hypothetical protein G6F23_014258 [Rhizopus arrhizus]
MKAAVRRMPWPGARPARMPTRLHIAAGTAMAKLGTPLSPSATRVLLLGSGRASLARDRHAGRDGPARADRAGAAAPGGAGDRSHPHRDPGPAGTGAGPAGDPDRARRTPDHGP